jgi:anaerobic selenocysteine-containing dehydrogenase
MTNTWADIKNTNLVVIMGGNAAEAHPAGSNGSPKPRPTTRPS